MATQVNPEDIPAIPPPEGMESNFVNPPSMYPLLLGIGITCMFIMTTAVCIRTYTKLVILKKFNHEDSMYLCFCTCLKCVILKRL